MIKNIFLVCAFAIASCKKQNGFSPVYDVPPEFQSYVTSFINEAATRGHQYTVNNLIIRLVKVIE